VLNEEGKHDQLDFHDLFDRQVTLPNRYAGRLAEAASSSGTDVGLFTARSARRRREVRHCRGILN